MDGRIAFGIRASSSAPRPTVWAVRLAPGLRWC